MPSQEVSNRGKVTIRVTRASGEVIEDTGRPASWEIVEVPPEVQEAMRDREPVQYAPVRRCIYCSRTEDLTREHIIPFGLSGNLVLPMSSCKGCARLTGSFEVAVLRGPMRAVRVLRRLRSYAKHRDAPQSQTLDIVRNGRQERIRVPLAEYPVLLHFPEFPPPRFLAGEYDATGINLKGLFTVGFGPTPEEVARRLGAERIVLTSGRDFFAAFARMIAKIAYGFAVAEGKSSLLDGPAFVLSAILGETEDIGKWVGTQQGPIRKFPSLLHRLTIREDRDRLLLFGDVHLFADSETPTYEVVLGRLKGPASAKRG